MNRAELLALSDERDAQLAARLSAERDGYRRGYADGFRDGSEELYARRRVLPPVTDPCAPSLAELEARRWGPGGREHFGDPRPGDYPGTEGTS